MKNLNIRKSPLYLLLRLTLIMITVSFFIGCAEVPITQRESLRLVPESELITMSFKEYQKVIEYRIPFKVQRIRKSIL